MNLITQIRQPVYLKQRKRLCYTVEDKDTKVYLGS